VVHWVIVVVVAHISTSDVAVALGSINQPAGKQSFIRVVGKEGSCFVWQAISYSCCTGVDRAGGNCQFNFVGKVLMSKAAADTGRRRSWHCCWRRRVLDHEVDHLHQHSSN